MNTKKLLSAGIVGSVVTAIGCFTPVLVLGLAVVGLSAPPGWLDYVLYPALAAFLGLTAYAVWRRRRAAACRAPEAALRKETT